MLLDELKKANMLALKEHDKNKRAILSVVINKCMLAQVEAKAKGQEIKDDDVLGIIQKTLKELDDEEASFRSVNRIEKADEILAQKDAIKGYLPQQMSEEEILKEMATIEPKQPGAIMKHFKQYGPKVDMKLVSTLMKQFLN